MEPLTCHTSNDTLVQKCYGRGECLYGVYKKWECQCSKYWTIDSFCGETFFSVVGNSYLVVPAILLICCSIFLFWLFLELLADRFQARKWNIKTPTFWAKLLLVASCIFFIISSALLADSIVKKTVVQPVAVRLFEALGIFCQAACSCIIITSWLTMISKAKKLDVHSGEGKGLRRTRFGTYIVLGIAAIIYVAIAIVQALGIYARTLNYLLLFVIIVFTLYVVLTSVVYLIRLSAWIKKEAMEHKSKILRKTLRKNSFLIAIDVLSVLFLLTQFASAPVIVGEVPKNFFYISIVVNIIISLNIFMNCLFLENHLSRHGSISYNCVGYVHAFKGIDSSSRSTKRTSAARGSSAPSGGSVSGKSSASTGSISTDGTNSTDKVAKNAKSTTTSAELSSTKS